MIRAVAVEFARRGVDSISAASEIDAVEVELEDLVFAELPLERHRQDRFLELAHEVAVVGQEDVAGQLLRDGRRRSNPVSCGHRRGQRSAKSYRIDTAVTAAA